MSNKRLLIDFDRVVHKYTDGWKDGTIYDVPVDGAIDSIKKLQSQGWQIVIFTTRSKDGDSRNYKIQDWLESYGFETLCHGLIDYVDNLPFSKSKIVITNTKIPARAIIDDRAIRFTNWRDILSYFI